VLRTILIYDESAHPPTWSDRMIPGEFAVLCEDARTGSPKQPDNTPALDPSNTDERFERVRVREALGESGWLDASAAGRSANNLASADEALDWAAGREWHEAVRQGDGQISYSPSPTVPLEILRRVVERALMALASEGLDEPLRGRELDGIVETLGAGRTATMKGVVCAGGPQWRFSKAPPRKSS